MEAHSLLERIVCHQLLNISFDSDLGICKGRMGCVLFLYHYSRKFIEGDTNEILYDIDKKIMEYDVCRMVDTTFEKGVEGLFWYLLSRLISQYKMGQPFDSVYLNNIRDVCANMKKISENQSVYLLNRFFEGKEIVYPYLDLLYRIIDSPKAESSGDDLTWQNGLRQLL